MDGASGALLSVFDPRFFWCIRIQRLEGSAIGQVLHGSATTPDAVRRAIQNSQESLGALASRYGVNPKTTLKCKERATVSDLPTCLKDKKSTALTLEEETMGVALRRHTPLQLDDCLSALQATIPRL